VTDPLLVHERDDAVAVHHSMESDDPREAMMAFLERRRPRFNQS
jgi:hypothetical protein